MNRNYPPTKPKHPNLHAPKRLNQLGSNNPNPPGPRNPNPQKQKNNYTKVPDLKPQESKPSISDIFNNFDKIFDQVADTLQIAVDEDLWPELKIEQNYPNLLEKNKETS